MKRIRLRIYLRLRAPARARNRNRKLSITQISRIAHRRNSLLPTKTKPFPAPQAHQIHCESLSKP